MEQNHGEVRGLAVKRFAQFVRSVIPSDPAQLFFLGGSILLFICMQLRSFPVNPDFVPGENIFLEGSYTDPLAKAYQSWLSFSIAARFPIVLAGAAGLFICFWPGSRPVRRILGFVCLPAIVGIASICVRFLSLMNESSFRSASVLKTGTHNEAWIISTLWNIGPALHLSVLGILLILFFLSRLGLGIAVLPLSLEKHKVADPDEDGARKRIQIFILPGDELRVRMAHAALRLDLAGCALPRLAKCLGALDLDLARLARPHGSKSYHLDLLGSSGVWTVSILAPSGRSGPSGSDPSSKDGASWLGELSSIIRIGG
jgi:hypothetical protein